jgi:hypothetical protein
VGEGGPDVLLLAAGGDVDVEFLEGADVAPDGACVAAEELGEVLLGEQAALFPGFLAEPPDAELAMRNWRRVAASLSSRSAASMRLSATLIMGQSLRATPAPAAAFTQV